MGISAPFSAPFFTGTASVAEEVPARYAVAVGGHPFDLELALYERQSVDRIRQQRDDGGEPGEQSLASQGPWARAGSRWDHGAGQSFWDIEGADRARFRSSKGVDIWTTERSIRLLHDTRRIRTSANANLKVLAVGAYLYVVDGNDVLSTTDPTVASPTYVDANIEHGGAPGSVSDITTDGTKVYAALGASGISQSALGAAVSTSLSAYAATLVQYANGRLLAAKTNELVEVPASGVVGTHIKDHANTSFAWTTIAGAPNGIYVGGNAGDRAEIYYIGLTDTGDLDVPRYAATLPDGETLNTMLFYNGAMLLGTSLGLRLAVLSDAGGLSYGPAIEIPNGGVVAVEPQGEFVWFTWKNYDGTSTGLGRCSLSIFTETLVPAYASDLMATTQGTVLSAATFGTKRYFAVSASGIWAEYTSLVASGSLLSGQVLFTTTERKVAVTADVRHEPLAGTVELDLTDENAVTTVAGTSLTELTLGPNAPFAIGSTIGESFEITVVLTRDAGDATDGPVVRRWTLHALATPRRVDEWVLPVILTTRVTVDDPSGGHEVDFRPLEEYLYLKSLESSGAPVRYQEGSQSYVVYVDSVGLPRDPGRRWTADRDFPEGLCFVHLVGLEPVA